MSWDVYQKRWQWWTPRGTYRWWLPRVFAGADEWCNDSVAFVIPPFGCFVIFWRPKRMRVVPCDECWADLNVFYRADYAPCGWLHGGTTDMSRHAHFADETLCEVSVEWLKTVHR